jgi:hypothetical protein
MSISARVKELMKESSAKLYEQAQEISASTGIQGYSKLNKRQLAHFIAKGEQGNLSARTTMHGKGPYRLIVARDNKMYGDLGPYATARAGLADGKHLLRRMAPKKKYALSNVQAQKFVGQKYADGVIVDGYITDPRGGAEDQNSGAFVLRVSQSDSTRPDEFPEGLHDKRKNSRRKRKRNPRVSFMTKDGPVSFTTKAKRKAKSKKRKNPGHDWIQKATAKSKAAGTEGAFTKQAKRAGYRTALSFAKAIMRRWRAGHKTVENKKTGRMQRVSVTTMRRANLAINMQKRRP